MPLPSPKAAITAMVFALVAVAIAVRIAPLKKWVFGAPPT